MIETNFDLNKGLEALRLRAERDTEDSIDTKRRPTWAPPLVLDGELLDILHQLDWLKTGDQPVARLWARFAAVKKLDQHLRANISNLPMPEARVRGFDLVAGHMRSRKTTMLSVGRRADGTWTSGMWGWSVPLSQEASNAWRALHDARHDLERAQRGQWHPDDIARFAAEYEIALRRDQEFDGDHRCREMLAERGFELAQQRLLSFIGSTDKQLIEGARVTGHCWRCWALLTDPLSVERGVGPDCYSRIQSYLQFKRSPLVA